MRRLCSCSLAAALTFSASAAVAAPHAPDFSTAVHSPAKAVNIARLEEEGDVAVAPETTAIFDRESKNAPRIHWDLVLVG